MTHSSLSAADDVEAPRLGPVLSEALRLLATLAAALGLVTLLVFAPRAFVSDELPTLESLAGYAVSVRDYVAGLLQGDLGVDQRGRAVSRELLIAGRRSLELLGASLLVAVPLGLGWGALLASFRRGVAGALLFGASTLLVSLPSFVVMLLAIEAVASFTLRTGIQLTYVYGYGLDRHLILPALVVGLRGAAFMARGLQVAQEDIMAQEWIRAARARGLGGLALWRRHALPALRLPLLGSLLGSLRVMVSAFVIVDFLYQWGGLGGKMLQVGNGGVVKPAGDQVAAGAAVLFVIFFVVTDAIGRWLLRRVDPRVRDMTAER